MKRFFKPYYERMPIVRELLEIRGLLANIQTKLDFQRLTDTIKMYDLALLNDPRYSDQNRLLRFGHQVNSQNAEDGMIQEIFRRIGVTNRYFVEIGVGNGTVNNTAFLLSQGWSGSWVDADPSFPAAGARLTPGRLSTAVRFVTRENIVSILSELAVPNSFDLLSIDTDQNTYYVWEALKELSPRVAVIEYNPVIPASVDWKVVYDPQRTWDHTHNYGASLKALEKLGARMGYRLVGCDYIGVNAFFVRDDVAGDHFPPPFTSEHHYEPGRIPLVHRRGFPASILDES